VQPGDQVRIDNSWVLALQTYQRHQVPTPDMYGWNQFRGADGQPVYPQRDALIGPIAAAGTAGSVPNGRIHGKMIVLEAVMDIDAFAWQADWYKTQVKAQLGSRFEDSFALWFIDHAQHDNPLTSKAHAHTVSFAGALQQALRDVSAWVERGMRPADTRCARGRQGQPVRHIHGNHRSAAERRQAGSSGVGLRGRRHVSDPCTDPLSADARPGLDYAFVR
jgi:hypothetical protein